MQIITLPASYYRQFDADYTRDIPGEGYGGWQKQRIEISREHTGVVVMHAWDVGTLEEYPGWYRAVEYIPRSYEICRSVLPPLLSAVRASGLKLFHVVGGGDYYEGYAGYRRAVELAGPEPESGFPQAESDPALQNLYRLKAECSFPGKHNQPDISWGAPGVVFPLEARPEGEEGIAENGQQLFALCRETGINHLIYAGFAINWCLLLSPGGMADMQKRGVMCSAFRQAVTAVENRETARRELCKELGLWRVALAFGFVFDVDDFIGAISS
ncbi:MAG: hypothetical protein IT210_07410 [Armatimonadetes bacterium]|nr:hypothetical protein [Armatimonadota bacterium]